MTGSGSARNAPPHDEQGFPPERIIRFPRTDFKNRDKFPTNTAEELNQDDEYNFMKLLGPTDLAHYTWRWKVGTYLADKVDNQPVDATGFLLEDFPQGYEFYDHHKGKPDKIRHDVYLFGPNNVGKVWRFRSVNEFLPHALWLYDTESSDPCPCKYCTGNKSQQAITLSLGSKDLLKSLASSSPKPLTKKDSTGSFREKIPRRSAPRASQLGASGGPSYERAKRVKKQPQPIAKFPAEMAMDLNRAYSFRQGEVVWCILRQPIAHPHMPGVSIRYWPGVVRSVDVDFDRPWTGKGKAPEGRQLPQTRHIFTIKFFAVSQDEIYRDDELMPLAAYSIPPILADTILKHAASSDESFYLIPQTATDSTPLGPEPSFEAASAPYMTACRTAEYLDTYFQPSRENRPTHRLQKPVKEPEVPVAGASSAPPAISEYFSLWRGSERIWVGDMVTLSIDPALFSQLDGFVSDADTSHIVGPPGLYLQVHSIRQLAGDRMRSDSYEFRGIVFQAVLDGGGRPTRSVTNSLNDGLNDIDPLAPGFSSSQPLKSDEAPQNPVTSPGLPSPPPFCRWRSLSLPGFQFTCPIDLCYRRYYPYLKTTVPDEFLPIGTIMESLIMDRASRKAMLKWQHRIILVLIGLESSLISHSMASTYMDSRQNMVTTAVQKAKNAVRRTIEEMEDTTNGAEIRDTEMSM